MSQAWDKFKESPRITIVKKEKASMELENGLHNEKCTMIYKNIIIGRLQPRILRRWERSTPTDEAF